MQLYNTIYKESCITTTEYLLISKRSKRQTFGVRTRNKIILLLHLSFFHLMEAQEMTLLTKLLFLF
jgi:hypothetical protein